MKSMLALMFGAVVVEGAPVMQVKLASPKNPFPSVSARISSLTAAREKTESELMQGLTELYDAVLADAQNQIDNVLHQSMLKKGPASFLGKSSGDYQVKLSYVPPAPIPASVLTRIGQLEHLRSQEERNMFAKAAGEMHSLTNLVVNEFAHELSRHFSMRRSTSFLATGALPQQANVRIAASEDSFPRVADLIMIWKFVATMSKTKNARKLL